MVIVTLRLLIVLQTVPSTSLEVTLTFTNYINPVVLDATLEKTAYWIQENSYLIQV